MKIIKGGVSTVEGFFAAGINAGIKKTKKDMALIFSENSCKAAGTFTKNLVKAAPVIWDMKLIENNEKVNAVVVNSGVANACTGEEGYRYCQEMAETSSKLFGISKENVLVASTGVIGEQLPIEKIKNGILLLKDNLDHGVEAGQRAAEAIMTTDTKSKEIAVEFEIEGKTISVGAMAKGSGMIHPDMCTMLAFITTNLNISKEMLQEALSEVVDETYNMISVDGDTSTNDTVLILANALANNTEIREKNQDYSLFVDALMFVNEYLAKKIAGDGEGATSLFEVKVINGKSREQVRKLSKSVITSSLTKAAIFGRDPNWGRIICALGYAKTDFEPDKVDIFFESKKGKIKIVENGLGTNYSEEEASNILDTEEVTVIIDLKSDDVAATAWGCDLTFDYVKINAEYRS